MEFPAFRSVEWINSTFNINQTKPKQGEQQQKQIGYFWVPQQVLRDVELMPEYFKNQPSFYLFKNRRDEMQREIRRTLFRQSLFKV